MSIGEPPNCALCKLNPLNKAGESFYKSLNGDFLTKKEVEDLINSCIRHPFADTGNYILISELLDKLKIL
jgi:hypothetical protein